MKVIIQIPAYNEEETLGVALNDLPKKLDGVETVEWLLIDDGSTDKTVQVATDYGVHHIVQLTHNQGLAKGFMAGLNAALKLGADIIVNTDADNQYCADDIQTIINPILERKADFVIGERPILKTPHFSPIKKLLQKFGSFVVRKMSGTPIQDAPSGFRAMSREAALRLNVFNEFTYTLETIIQAGNIGLKIVSVPVRTNGYLRPSRLFKSIPQYVQRSIFTIIRSVNAYRPMGFFFRLGIVPLVLGLILLLRWVLLFMGQPASHIPSLIVAAILIVIGVQVVVFGLMADIIAVNRKLLEDIQQRVRRSEYDSK